MASVQWDRWQFMFSAKKLHKLKINPHLLSHGHFGDHLWIADPAQLLLVPEEIRFPNDIKHNNTVYVGRHATVGKMHFTKLRGHDVGRLIGDETVDSTHAFWWIVDSAKTRALFIGDMDLADVRVARAFIERSYDQDLKIHAILLPSFGGVTTHGSLQPLKLANTMSELAYDLRDIYRITIAALPHPVEADWANYNATHL